MKLLVLYPHLPWPLDRGVYHRTFNLLKSLGARHEVDFLALTDEPGDPSAKRDVFTPFCREVEILPFAHPPWQKLLPDRLFNPLPSNVQHWQSSEVRAAVDRRLTPGRYDLVHICDLVLAPYVLPHAGHTPFVLDRSRVDLQFQLMEHRTLNFSLLTRMLRWESYAKLWRYEKRVARTAALEVVCGPDDEAFLRRWVRPDLPVEVVVNGVDVDYFRPDAVPDPRDAAPTVLFCGAMDYSPNVDALEWFFAEMHAPLLAKVPDLRVLLVGKNPVEEVRALASRPGVTVTGGVPDVRPYYRRAHVQMVPLRIGGGTRLKIVESLAIGTPVVSTTIGAQGLDLQHGRDILLADTPAAFADELAKVLGDAVLRESLGQYGLTAARTRFGWPAIGARLAERYESLPFRRPRQLPS